MKVGTDAVLLGAWMPVPEKCKSILEIGSGCGVISLMLAQRTKAEITGVDIDGDSVEEAKKNSDRSPWMSRVQFFQERIQEFTKNTSEKFDVIVSNPPFFEKNLKSPIAKKNISKHNDSLAFEELANTVDTLLTQTGYFGLIMSVNSAVAFEKIMLSLKFFATKKTMIFPTRDKNANRILMLFERIPNKCKEKSLIIRDNGYTNEYRELIKEYLTIKN
jgi:tRNA1Val (adenine37-N6)-methyltransferase